MRVVVIGSGSQGNCTLFEHGSTRILVDAGLSLRELKKRLTPLGLADTRFDALVITHSHGDHVQHAARWSRRLSIPVYATKRTQQEAPAAFEGADIRELRPRGVFTTGSLRVHTLPLPHDAAQVAVIAQAEEERCALVTDLGHIPKSLARGLAECQTVLLESNHCSEMMEMAPYPSFLKRRIRSDRGHLSNRQAASLVRSLPSLQRLVLMHLSQKANSPRRARSVALEALQREGRAEEVELLIAEQNRTLELHSLMPPKRGQLALGF